MLYSFSDSKLASIKPLKLYKKNGEKKLSLIEKINTLRRISTPIS